MLGTIQYPIYLYCIKQRKRISQNLKFNIMNRITWEMSGGKSDYQDWAPGRAITKTTYTRRLETNTDPLKNRSHSFGKGMKKAFIRMALGKYARNRFFAF